MSNYAEREPLNTFWERLLAFHIYVLRKIVFYVIRADFWLMRQFSRPFGFYMKTEVEDSDSWKWFKNWSFPRYRAYVERKD